MRIKEDNYVDKAEQVIKKVKIAQDNRGKTINMVTTSQIRNILAMVSDIYNQVMNENSDTLSEELLGRIDYLRIRVIYEVGRDGREGPVKTFVKEAEILDILKEIGNSKKNYILFQHYMEALVAFHKFYGGKDK